MSGPVDSHASFVTVGVHSTPVGKEESVGLGVRYPEEGWERTGTKVARAGPCTPTSPLSIGVRTTTIKSRLLPKEEIGFTLERRGFKESGE